MRHVRIEKSAFQYVENHDHARFICNFGTYNLDTAQNPLFRSQFQNHGH